MVVEMKRMLSSKPAHKPWTLSSDGKGRVTIVLGSSYGTNAGPMRIPSSVEDMTDVFDGEDNRFSLVKFLRALADFDGDLVALAASGKMGRAFFSEAFEVLGHPEDHMSPALAIPCPYCGAKVGEECSRARSRTRMGDEPPGFVHTERKQIVERNHESPEG